MWNLFAKAMRNKWAVNCFVALLWGGFWWAMLQSPFGLLLGVGLVVLQYFVTRTLDKVEIEEDDK